MAFTAHYFAFAKIKEINASINNIKIQNISHISRKDVPIIFDNIALAINTNSIANKNVIPKAVNFLVFPI
ncbi:MAG: hypothetical protein HFH68_03260 [Lachnospiraceae bacterium]|nr:hypothetical protein [Lachnospiraceae bacterium]